MERKYHKSLKQNTPVWDAIRRTRLGSSKNPLFVNGKGEHGLGVAAISESYRIVAALNGWYDEEEEGYKSPAMEAGNEFEPHARLWYEQEYKVKVDEVGYISLGDYFGYSPDGLVMQDGLIEIKCPQGKEYARFAITEEIPKDHWNQMQWGMFVADRKWCNYICYNQFTGVGIVRSVAPDPDTHKMLAEKCEAFNQLMEENLNKLNHG